jgi:GDPmannose 4,6-dehydratase
MKKALITGVTGQDGSYLAEFLLDKDYEVHGIKRRSSSFNTDRLDHLYQDPHAQNRRFVLHYGDTTDSTNLISILQQVQPDEVYNLAAQSHVHVSFEMPEYTANADALGTLRMLEAIRILGLEKKTKFYQASTSELFSGKIGQAPQNEKTPFAPRSPYATAKLYAYWIVENYKEAYGIFACNGILFNHECLTAQTPVIIKKNDKIDILAIEELVPHRENPRHGIKYTTTAGEQMVVWDGNAWTRVKTMTATWNKAGSFTDKKVRQVLCRGGYYEATQDHLSFLKGGETIKTGNLNNGHELELKGLPDLSSSMVLTAEESEFLGMMVADGYVHEDGKGRLINDDKKIRLRLADLWAQVAGGSSREDSHPSGFYEGDVASVELFGNPDYLRMIRKEIYNEKKFKKVPKRVLNSSPDLIRSFLHGYNLCDGLKAGHQKTKFKSFTTNSPVLAMGLWYLVDKALSLRITLHPEFRGDKKYFHLNINSDNKTQKGKHLQREISEVKNVKDYAYDGWLFDLETESGTFSAGIGLTWVHNSPRRGETFVTRKITMAAARISVGLQEKLYLGNLNNQRDWGHAKDYVEAMWLMLQRDQPENFVIATGKQYSVREFCEKAFSEVGLELEWEGQGINEKGINKKTGKVVIEIDQKYFRPLEVESLLGDASKARNELGWQPKITFETLVKEMVASDLELANRDIHLEQGGFSIKNKCE